MAEEQWVRVKGDHAGAGRGFDLVHFLGLGDQDDYRYPNGDVVRWQRADGSVTMRRPNGLGGVPFVDAVTRGRLPVWQPPKPVSNAPYQSPFAGRRDANVQAIQQTGRGISSAAAPPPSAPAPAPAGQRPAAPAAPPPAAPATPARQQPAAPQAVNYSGLTADGIRTGQGAMAPGFTLPSHSWTGPGREAYSGTPQISADAALNAVGDRLTAQPMGAADSPFAVHRPASAGTAPAVAGSNPGQWRTQEDLDLARRRAFLDSSDSAAGVKAVRGLLMDEARNRGIDISGGGSIPAIKFLEQQLAKNNANRNGQTSTVPASGVSGQSPAVSLPAEQRQAIQAAGDAAGKVAFAPGAVMSQANYGSGAVPSLVAPPANADEIAKAGNTAGARAFGPGAVMPQANYGSGQSPAVSLPAEQRQAIQAAGDAAGKVAFAPGAVMPQANYGSGAVPSLVAPPANADEIAKAGNTAGARAFAPQAVMDTYMRTDVAGRASAGQDPPGQVASWQSAPVFVAPRQDPGREAMLAAHAALGEKPPTTPGEAVLAVGASNAYGTRGGQFKPGNTVNLGEIPADKLPPRNSTGYYSGAAIGELRGYNWGGNPGNYQQLF